MSRLSVATAALRSAKAASRRSAQLTASSKRMMGYSLGTGNADHDLPDSCVPFHEINRNRFDDHKLKDAVNAEVYTEFHKCLKDGSPLSKSAGNAVAEALMKWAMDLGAVQYAHWFSPIRGANGLKLDAFLDYDFGGQGTLDGTMKDMKVDFSGSKLFFNETDGSSFPNGGLRQTHRAAAFMNWDRLSPPFVRNGVLYLPSSFVTHNGDAIDEKTPLLRSEEAINEHGLRLLRCLGDNESQKVVSNVGWEQEFFVVDREAFLARPDLMSCGRMLVGAQPSRGQQTDFNYFNKTNPRVRQFFDDVQAELLNVGIPLTVFHNEVAPSQHEFSPIFKLTNVAADENILSMEVCEDVAVRHGLSILFHEKPFAGINGSGKHSNWGLNTDTGKNLYVPGKDDAAQESFMAFVAALTRAVHLHGDIIRTGVATASNDHRLGAQEAPPAIMSLYTGDIMYSQIEKILAGGDLPGYGMSTTSVNFGSTAVSPVQANLEDRNRTAPFPFCGNRFEFRAVGSTQNIAFPISILNTAVAESIGALASEIEGGKSVREAVADMFDTHKAAIFNGDGYSDEWPVEAAERGLPNLRNTVEAVESLCSDKNKQLFSSVGVFSPEELGARQEIMFEKYINDLTIEADCLLDMMQTGALPACAKDLSVMGSLAGNRSSAYSNLETEVNQLQDIVDNLPSDDSVGDQAKYCVESIKPQLEAVRAASDTAERLVDADLWPFPKYKDILYTHHSEAPQHY